MEVCTCVGVCDICVCRSVHVRVVSESVYGNLSRNVRVSGVYVCGSVCWSVCKGLLGSVRVFESMCLLGVRSVHKRECVWECVYVCWSVCVESVYTCV